MEIIIWACAALLYLLFRLWYDGQGKPLTAAEVDYFLDYLSQRPEAELSALNTINRDRETLRKFLQEDDGKEFIMVNLIQFNTSPVAHPDTGDAVRAQALLAEYSKPFFKRILPRAGHPVIFNQAAGGYLDSWNTPETQWHSAALVRYRSRRDMVRLVTDPYFAGIHKYKVAALRQTYAFPSKKLVSLYASPRLVVALALSLCAALLQLLLT